MALSKSASGSTLVNRQVRVGARRTSVRLEQDMWRALFIVSADQSKTVHELVTAIDRTRSESSLTAAIRVYLVLYFEQRTKGLRRAPRQSGRRAAAIGEAMPPR